MLCCVAVFCFWGEHGLRYGHRVNYMADLTGSGLIWAFLNRTCWHAVARASFDFDLKKAPSQPELAPQLVRESSPVTREG